jgi:hypothetical protein
MLDLNKLLVKLITSIGGEPIISFIPTGDVIPYSISDRKGARVGVGIADDQKTCWTVTALGTPASSNYQYYLVEVYSWFTVKYSEWLSHQDSSNPPSATSGSFYRAYFNQSASEHTAHPNFYTIATANLSSLVNVGGSPTLLSRVGFGSATTTANTGTSSFMHSDICFSSDGKTIRFQAHRAGAAPSNANTYCYIVSLWGVDNPTYFF